MTLETLTTDALIENLDTVIAFVEDRAEQFDLETKQKFGLLIAIEEAFVNVCHYAYPQTAGEVSVSCGSEGEAFVVEISDHGEPFDVLSLPDPDITADIMDREVGGLGVFFIRKLTNDVSYRRTEGQNILRMALRKPCVTYRLIP
jgi:anti-sigma regulatory factor (Ser/Thr protein kinase)